MLPNAWDVVSARLFQIEGFKAIGTTSAGIAATLGYPDGQRMSLTNNLAVVRRIAERIDLPISADIEAGYATSIDGVVQAARAALEAGAVGINLEDGTGFDRVVQWRKYYKTAECLEEQVIDGKTCYQIVMTPNNGEPETRYYDKQSGLLVKAKKTRLSSNMSPLSAELSFSDYRKVDGLLIAHKVKHESNMCGSKREMLFVTERVSHNVKLPPDRFDPPEEIRALAKK
ncbi:MAG: isocitrate lyase/phosphoenolpyruvate mutase family protein, partial [Phycisphaerae bacterium]